MSKKAVVLFSGGLDSITCLAIAKDAGFECYTLAFDYGQKHRSELSAAIQLSNKYGAAAHRTLKIGIGDLGGSALTDTHLTVPDFQQSEEIPITYVPARNTVFLSIALGWAEVINASDIFTGVSAVDYSNYPDCRPEFIAQFEKLSNLATKKSVEGSPFKIHAPLIHLSKAQTIQQGIALGIDYSESISCYRANEQGEACATCDSCVFRKNGFIQAGIPDPTRYYIQV